MIEVQPEIVDIGEEGGIPTSITIKLGDGTRMRLRLAETVDLECWDIEHLDGHRRTGTALFLTYEERADEFVATKLSE